jgi:biotin carboxyl carrier protein
MQRFTCAHLFTLIEEKPVVAYLSGTNFLSKESLYLVTLPDIDPKSVRVIFRGCLEDEGTVYFVRSFAGLAATHIDLADIERHTFMKLSGTGHNVRPSLHVPSLATNLRNAACWQAIRWVAEAIESSISAEVVDVYEGVAVTIPFRGVVHRAPSPTKPEYVQVGDRVEAGQVIALHDAMKTYSEITAPVSGIVQIFTIVSGQEVGVDEVICYIMPEAA